MPKGYCIVHIDVSDPQGYQSYIEANGAVFREYGAGSSSAAGLLKWQKGACAHAMS
jgi:uncharacterized protein (DUF1330 family)